MCPIYLGIQILYSSLIRPCLHVRQLSIHDSQKRANPFLFLLVHTYFTRMLLQCSFLLDLLICLDLIVDLEVLKAFKTDTALTTLAHLHDILFDVLERVDFTCRLN